MPKVSTAVLEKPVTSSTEAARARGAILLSAAVRLEKEAHERSFEAAKLSLEELSPKLFAYAIRIWGSSREAVEWFLHPHRELDTLSPLTVLGTEDGPERVRALLIALDHGFPV